MKPWFARRVRCLPRLCCVVPALLAKSKVPLVAEPRADELVFANRLLGFSRAVAARFERDTGEARIAHMRRTALIGILFYNAYNFSNVILISDLLWSGVFLRVAVATPLTLALIWVIGRVPPSQREALATMGMASVVVIPVALFWTSRHPLAGYSFSDVMLTLVFGTMMLQLRVPYTIALVSFSLPTMLAAVATKPGLDGDLRAALALQSVSTCFLVLYGNYLIESARRGAYLVSLRAIVRADGLETDRREFAALSTTDALTGLPNRRPLDDALAEWNATPPPERAAVGVVMIDVDHFKAFNDAYGHPVGDTCLRGVAGAIGAEIRGVGDLAVRYGGEEFAVLLQPCDEPRLERTLERLRAAVAALAIPHSRNDEGGGMVTVSLGGALAPAAFPGTSEALFLAADAALYEAKRTGRNRCARRSLAADPSEDAPALPAAA